MFAAIFGAFADFLKIFGIVLPWIKQSQDQDTGAKIEAGKVSEEAAKADKRIADVEATPVTDADVDDALGKGTF